MSVGADPYARSGKGGGGSREGGVDAGGRAIPPDDAWLEITGRLVRQRGKFVVAARSIVPIKARDPYLTSWDF